MSSELVIDVKADEIIIALLREKKLVELTKEKTSMQFAVGDIYLGKVKKIMPGLNAAFVNVGYEKDAFLHYLDLSPQFHSLDSYIKQCIARKGMPVSRLKLEPEISKNGKISDVLTVGQWVAVQVAKEPISTKGPRLTSELSIAGRNMVLMPFTDKVSVSQKIKSPEERKRLKRLIESIKPKNYGVIVRTVAEGKKVATFDAELKELVSRFETAFKHIRDMEPPKLILGEIDRTSAILRDILNPSFENIYVNDITLTKEIRHFLTTIAPEKQDIVKYVSPEIPILDHFGVEPPRLCTDVSPQIKDIDIRPQPAIDGEMSVHYLTVFFTVFVMLQFWNLFNASVFGTNHSIFKDASHALGMLGVALIILVGQFLIVTFGGKVFRTEPLPLMEWLYIIGGTSFVLWGGEAWRGIKRLMQGKAA